MHVCVAALIQFYDMFSVKLGYCLHIMNQARPLVELFECSINTKHADYLRVKCKINIIANSS